MSDSKNLLVYPWDVSRDLNVGDIVEGIPNKHNPDKQIMALHRVSDDYPLHDSMKRELLEELKESI